MNQSVFGFIGLGLIGGSIARAIREKIPGSTIIAYDIHTESLLAAQEEAVADVITFSIDENFRNCNLIFLCAPVRRNQENIRHLKKYLAPECLLTDVGSVKSDIHLAIEAEGLSSRFIGGHPMAGSERVGYVNSKAMLLQNAYYILTPTDQVSREQTDALQNLVKLLGALPLVLTCRQHDYVTAAVSHLPHVIAASLVNLVRDSDSREGIMKMIAAGGFKDITRIASSSAVMWQQICLTNTENISRLLSAYIASLETVKAQLDQHNGDCLYDFFEDARVYRDSFISAPSGPIKRSYSINIDIADEPGALASIATILALNGISIKNIGIVHNREFEGGVLRIEFYEEISVEKGRQILNNKGYTIHEPK